VIIMAVSLPTAADVRKVREQAARNAAERAEVARTPLLAVLGAGDYAVTTVTKAVATARTRATEQAETVQQRVAELPDEIGGLRDKLNTDELRKAVNELGNELRAQAEQAYADLAERGELAWGRIRRQPQVQQALSAIETYTEKLDARVDDIVDDAHDAAEKALATVTTQTRSTGERVARATQRFAGQTAETVDTAGKEAAEAVAEAGSDVAEAVTEAGDNAAATTRSTTRKAANRTAPQAPAKPAARKPATRRSGS
jgi:heparin binding hemagglutinin HbhA